MSRLLTLVLALLLGMAPLAAQTAAERQQWLRETTEARHNYLTSELHLSAVQQARFFPLYDGMDSEIRALYDNLRRQCEAVEAKGDRATDAERLAVVDAQFEAHSREGEIEARYLPRFKEVLTPAQLFKLKKVERDFNRRMMREHHNRRPGARHGNGANR